MSLPLLPIAGNRKQTKKKKAKTIKNYPKAFNKQSDNSSRTLLNSYILLYISLLLI